MAQVVGAAAFDPCGVERVVPLAGAQLVERQVAPFGAGNTSGVASLGGSRRYA